MRKCALLAAAVVVLAGWVGSLDSFSAAQEPAQGATRPAITGIAFMRMYTTHPEQAQRFYGQTLGFAQEQAGDMWVYPVNRLQWLEVTTAAPPEPNCRMAAVAFTTRDAAGLERYLKAHGVAIEKPLADGEFGVRDPEGNLVLFVQSTAAGATKQAGATARLVASAAASAHATSRRVIHVGFIVHDRDKEAAFWKGILGFRPYWYGGQTDQRTDYVSLQVPDGTDWLEFMLNQPPGTDLRQTGVMDHFSLGVEHMDSVLGGLQANQCEGKMCTAIQAGRDGKVQLNVYDPDMTRVEYMEFTPAMKPCCSTFTGPMPGLEENR
jgi:catechol 2,3-dioxygenase-like lactoylglutathione lyase family enzyme